MVFDVNIDEVRGWFILYYVVYLLWFYEDDEEERWRRDEFLYFGDLC